MRLSADLPRVGSALVDAFLGGDALARRAEPDLLFEDLRRQEPAR